MNSRNYSNPYEKFCLSIFILLMISFTGCKFYDLSLNKDDKFSPFLKKKVIVKKLESQVLDKTQYRYLALQYDFEDSIAIYVDGKFLNYHFLTYNKPDSNSTIFPYNRMLLKLGAKGHEKGMSVLFIRSRLLVASKFGLNQNFYYLVASKQKEVWEMYLSKIYPWPD